jgi:Family of unknown function (DUF5946)
MRALEEWMNDNEAALQQYHELCGYSLTHADPAFLHQHVVDAFAAQIATASTKPITLIFALVGLYLHVEKHQSGKQVQRVHTLLARRHKNWPRLNLPTARGDVTVSDVMSAPAGPARDALIDTWCASVWAAYRACHDQVAELIQTELP